MTTTQLPDTMSSVTSNEQPATYTADGRRYIVRDVHLLERADSHLFNDSMEVQIDHRGRCRARFLQPSSTPYADNLRSFYLRDEETGELWSAPFEPVQAEPKEFEYSPGLGDVQWRAVFDGVEITLRLVVPREDQVELWTATVTNRSGRPRRLSLYPYFPIGQLGWITQIAKFDAKLGGITVDYFPYYVKVEDYYRLRTRKNWVFCVGDRAPLSAEANLREFLGGRTLQSPRALQLPQLEGNEAIHEPAVVLMQYPLALADGAADTLNFVLGPAQDRVDMRRLKRKYLAPGGVEKALKQVYRYLKTLEPAVRVETPDTDFNHYVNYWLPQQTHFCGGLLRMDGEVCVRNAFQDAMGATFNMPQNTRRAYLAVYAHQHVDGFLPHGAALAEGVDRAMINSIPHRDMNVWPPLALDFYMKETGDLAILDEQVGFLDDAATATVYDHVCRGLEWQLRDRTDRDLCRIGEGDWDDPLNMAGWQEKGESIWLTEALAIALDTWAVVADLRGDADRAAHYRAEADTCRRAINEHAWNGGWYARGTTDAGDWFGVKTDTEGKIFLNAQSWAMICGAADAERLQACIKAVNKHLMSPSGPMTMGPAFTSMREDIGKITQKTAGTYENGSVYCHAAAFYAYGLFRARQTEEGFRMLRILLAGGKTNTPERAQMIPTYMPNFYRGTFAGKTAGRASGHWGTGTVAWFYRTAITELLGVRGEYDGLRIDPQLPKAWRRAKLWRKFRGAEYTITIRRSRTDHVEVLLDGLLLPDTLIPPQAPGSKHKVEVRVPMR